MPEYLAPGVYVEEHDYGRKPIEGVGTSTAGFVGPARFGPVEDRPQLLTSFADFERIYGGLDQLVFVNKHGRGLAKSHNFLAHGVRAFFEEGGRRLYVARIYEPPVEGTGIAEADNGNMDSPSLPEVRLAARFPGRAGNMRVTFIPHKSENLLFRDPATNGLHAPRVQDKDTVLIVKKSAPTCFCLYDVERVDGALRFKRPLGTTLEIRSDGRLYEVDDSDNALKALEIPPEGYHRYQAFLVTVEVSIEHPLGRPKGRGALFGTPENAGVFSFHPEHARALTSHFAREPLSRDPALSSPFAIGPDASLVTGVQMAKALLGPRVIRALKGERASRARRRTYRLKNGSDGRLPEAGSYEGGGFAAFEELDDISTIAAPGSSYTYRGRRSGEDAAAIQTHLVSHCERMRYRFAVLDAPEGQSVKRVRAFRNRFESKHAALYYPWVTVLDPITEKEINLPPSGFVAGIYARNDTQHGVHKAPANEKVRLASGLERLLNKAQQEVLNPDGVNCIRFFEGRGYLLWGARTISSDPEWKYVNVRRYFSYLEHSIDNGTQWTVFEPNGESLWSKVQMSVEDFLYKEWKSGRLAGDKPDQAFFVRCDSSTTTQMDIDLGRLIFLIGVAPSKPAEFVIFRIVQQTADHAT